jgi:hypothetical protein
MLRDEFCITLHIAPLVGRRRIMKEIQNNSYGADEFCLFLYFFFEKKTRRSTFNCKKPHTALGIASSFMQ